MVLCSSYFFLLIQSLRLYNLVITGIVFDRNYIQNLDPRVRTSRDSVYGLEIVLAILHSLERFWLSENRFYTID